MKNLLQKYGIHSVLRDGEGSGSGGADDIETIAGGVDKVDDGDGDGDEQDGDDGDGDGEDKSSEEDEDGTVDGEDKSDKGGDDTDDEYVDDPNLTDEENAAAKKEHDDAKAAADADKDKDKKEGDGLKADEYLINAPEGANLDDETEATFRSFAEKKKLAQSDVDELVGIQTKLMEKQAEATAELVKQWGQELRADKTIGGPEFDKNQALARKTVDALFVPHDANFKAMMKQTGLGNYPPFVKGMIQIGTLFDEAGIVLGGVVDEPQDHETILYGDDSSK